MIRMLSRVILIGCMTMLLLTSQPSFAQRETFDVASIKPSQPGPAAGPPRVAADGRRFTASNATFRLLLQFAYRPGDGRSLRNADMVGAPEWSDVDRFNIEAKLDDAALPVSSEQMQSMVQNLLSNRFQLKVRWDKRDNVDVYNLVVSKDGSKLKGSEDQTTPRVTPAPAPVNPSAPPPRGQTRTIATPTGGTLLLTLSGSATPVSPDLISLLQGFARRPVLDKTGLKGLFDFRLQFVMDPPAAPAVPAQAPAAAADPSGPSFFSAIQEQLGLRLEPAKGIVDVLVIESVQKPSEN